MKDSSGDADHTRRTIQAFSDFAVFPGAEVYLLDAMNWGATGCISATANINAKAIANLIATFSSPRAEVEQQRLNAVRKAVQSRGLVPAVKAVLSARYKDGSWRNVRPPLVPLADNLVSELFAEEAIKDLL